MKYEKVNAELSYYYKNTTNGYNIVFTNLLPDEGVPVLADGSPYYYKTTSPDNSKYVMFYIGSEVENDWNFEERLNSLMVEETSERLTANDYEQYRASPSPDYPSEVETVGSNVNEFDINTVSYGDLDTATGKKINDVTYVQHSDYIEVASNEIYIINFNNTLTKRVFHLDKDKNVISTNIVSTEISKFTTSENVKYFRVKIIGVFDKKTKLEKGTIATPYSPYNQGSVEVRICNKNFIKMSESQQIKSNGITAIKIKNGWKIQGTSTAFVGLNLGDVITKAGTYTFSSNFDKSSTGFYLRLRDKTTNSIITELENNQITFRTYTIKSNVNANLIINIPASTTVDTQVTETQFEKNIAATSFVEHEEQTAIMPIQQELLENDYIADVEHHEWGKIVLTGDESWNYTQIETKAIHYLQIETKTSKIEGLICNQYKYVGKEHSWQEMENNQIGEENRNNFIFIRNDSITSQADFKTYLKQQYEAGTPVTIYYKLATSLDLELTDEQKAIRDTKLYTYKNVTNISVSDELTSIEVEYKKDLETEHNKLQNEIDEIKQLLSTTQTSALLLDNLQKDVESEVE